MQALAQEWVDLLERLFLFALNPALKINNQAKRKKGGLASTHMSVAMAQPRTWTSRTTFPARSAELEEMCAVPTMCTVRPCFFQLDTAGSQSQDVDTAARCCGSVAVAAFASKFLFRGEGHITAPITLATRRNERSIYSRRVLTQGLLEVSICSSFVPAIKIRCDSRTEDCVLKGCRK
jgi:hypothetical protein